MAAPFRIVFEEDGYPRELIGPEDWARAVRQGALRPDMEITLYRHGESPSVRKAAAVDELRPLFGLAEPSGDSDQSAGGGATAVGASDLSPKEAGVGSASARRGKTGDIEAHADQGRVSARLSPLPSNLYSDSTSVRIVTTVTGGIRFAAKDGRSFDTALEALRHEGSIFRGSGLGSAKERAPSAAPRSNFAIRVPTKRPPDNRPTRPAVAPKRRRPSGIEDKQKKTHWGWLVLLIIVIYVLAGCSAAPGRHHQVGDLLACSPALDDFGRPAPVGATLAARATRDERLS